MPQYQTITQIWPKYIKWYDKAMIFLDNFCNVLGFHELSSNMVPKAVVSSFLISVSYVELCNDSM